MKAFILGGILLLALVGVMVAWYWFNDGVSHRDICEVVRSESAGVQQNLESRYQDLDRKLDRIEGKLDRLLKLAERPLPDNLKRID